MASATGALLLGLVLLPGASAISVASLKQFPLQQEGGLEAQQVEDCKHPPMGVSYAAAEAFCKELGGAEEFEADLSSAQKEELRKKQSFEELKEAKKAELEAGKKQLVQLQEDDADVRSKNEQAYEEYTDTYEQVQTDKTFMQNLERRCKEKDEEYAERTKSRLAELQAVEETIAYLSSDDAFETFERSLNSPGAAVFLQTRSLSFKAQKASTYEPQVSALLSLAEHTAKNGAKVSEDAFAKVNAAIDKMVADLTEQQKVDVEEKDYCIEEIAVNKREAQKNQDKLENLQALVADLTRAVEQLAKTRCPPLGFYVSVELLGIVGLDGEVPQGLLEALREGPPHRHGLAHALHARAHLLVDRRKLARLY